jgi:transcription elongation factor Elf1
LTILALIVVLGGGVGVLGRRIRRWTEPRRSFVKMLYVCPFCQHRTLAIDKDGEMFNVYCVYCGFRMKAKGFYGKEDIVTYLWDKVGAMGGKTLGSQEGEVHEVVE